MTRKDYIVLARALASVRPLTEGSDEWWQWVTDCASISMALAEDNPRFDLARFSAACAADV